MTVISHFQPAVDFTCGLLIVKGFECFASRNTLNRGLYYTLYAVIISFLFFIINYSLMKNQDFIFIWISLSIGIISGIIASRLINVSRLPKFICFSHALLGLTSLIIGFSNANAEFCLNEKHEPESECSQKIGKIQIYYDVIFGCISFIGSLVGFLKFHQIFPTPKRLPNWLFHTINFILVSTLIGANLYLLLNEYKFDQFRKFRNFLSITALISLILGLHFSMGIGILELPINVSLMNSVTGWTIGIAGYYSRNNLLNLTGFLCGITGILIAHRMCRIQNKSLISIIIGLEIPHKKIHNKNVEINSGAKIATNSIKENNLLKFIFASTNIIIIPGFGMALSQSQYLVREMINILQKLNKNIKICIHPLSGRLPGHLNALLDEAGVNPSLCYDMKEINKDFENCDLALVIGGNDIVNCASEEDQSSPIYGMKVCKVWNAKKCVVMKRSLSTGYNNIENPLFSKENTYMFLGDAYENLTNLLNLMKKKISMRNSLLDISMKELDSLRKDTVDNRSVIKYLNIGIPKETAESENRVSIIPCFISKFENLGFNIFIEENAGQSAGFSDEEYIKEGATIMNKNEIYESSDIIIKIRPPLLDTKEYKYYHNTKFLICNMDEPYNSKVLKSLTKYKQLNVLDIDLISHKFHAFDYRSVISNVLGYRAIIEAFYQLDLMNQLISSKNKPNKVLIIGSGLLAKSAIINARKFGANVFVYDLINDPQVENLEAENIKFTCNDVLNFDEEELVFLEKYIIDINIILFISHSRSDLKRELLGRIRNGSIMIDLTEEIDQDSYFTQLKEICNEKNGKIRLIQKKELLSKVPKLMSEIYSEYIYHIIEEICDDGKESISAKNFDIDKSNQNINQIIIIKNGKEINQLSKTQIKNSNITRVNTDNFQFQKMNNFNYFDRPSFIKRFYLKYNDFIIPFLVTIIFCAIIYTVSVVNKCLNITKLEYGIFTIYFGYYLISEVDCTLYSTLITFTNSVSGVLIYGLIILYDNENFRKCESRINTILVYIGLTFTSFNLVGGLLLTNKLSGFQIS